MTKDNPSLREFQVLILGLANKLREAYGSDYHVTLASDLMEQAAQQLRGLKHPECHLKNLEGA